MSIARVIHSSKKIKTSIDLPSSKSISNRALILQALCEKKIELDNISTADDTSIMMEALLHRSKIIDVKNAGTCLRFLTAYFACIRGEVELHGDERMKKRPVKILVDALRILGAEITYLDEEGFPPLKIKGKDIKGGKVIMDASISSQYITALMLVAPTFTNGLTIELTGEISSRSYIDMTFNLMKYFGFECSFIENEINVSRQPVNSPAIPVSYTIEPDWSAASYWYEIAALSNEAEILLKGLTGKSLQGDSAIAALMEPFGVETVFTDEGVVLKKNGDKSAETSTNISASPGAAIEKKSFNLLNTPDLVPALAVTAAAKNTEMVLSGLRNLRIKESDRLYALENELKKCGFDIIAKKGSLIINKSSGFQLLTSGFRLQTHQDHRLAMSFAPLALVFDDIWVEQPEVVEKSYPHFWEDLKTAGFEISASTD